MKKIINIVKKIPAAIVMLPLFLGILINLILDASMDKEAFSGYTGVVQTISNVLMMILVFGVCSQLNFRKVGKSLSRGGVLLLLKFLVGAGISLLVALLAGPAGVLGISALAIVAAISNPNTALFAGISQTYGEDEDTPSIMLMCLAHGPAFSLLILSASGIANVDFLTMIIPIIPMVAGIIVGNLWPKIQPVLYKAAGAILPVFTLLLGTTISLLKALEGGAQGLLLGVITLLLTGVLAFFVSRVYMGKGKFSPMAVAAGTTAGNAILVPAFIGGLSGVSEELAAAAEQATAQVAGSMIITALLAPILVAVFFKFEQRRREKLGIEKIVTMQESKTLPQQKELVEANNSETALEAVPEPTATSPKKIISEKVSATNNETKKKTKAKPKK